MVPIHIEERSGRPSFDRLQFIAKTFPHSVWINPKLAEEWPYTRTIQPIREIFPMYEADPRWPGEGSDHHDAQELKNK